MAPKKSNALYTVLAVTAALLVLGGVGLFWIAFRGIQMLQHEAAHASTVMMGDASSLAGKADWIGTWEGGGKTLRIDPSGTAQYEEKSANSSEKLDGSVSFDGADMVIDVLVMKKRMHVDKPPHLDGTTWKATLDGVEVERK
ncbi:MAG TPA: hypothetical protein VGH87_12645 [Polyangiaceae bacterium]|nr:hypothetical protein [Polyangiaceae bacterium]